MGTEVSAASFSREQRQKYREKVRLNLDVFERMLQHAKFDADREMTGMEIELNLVDKDYEPKLDNATVLEAIENADYQTELARYNIEFNVAPTTLEGTTALSLEDDLRASLNEAERKANEVGAHILMIGILPTVMPEHFEGDWMSANTRYQALNDAVLAARGEDIYLDIEGSSGEKLDRYADSLAPESACTSMQLHLQVDPSNFANYWNAAQVLAGPQLGVGANSPYFFGQQLWHETRIELFSQAADTRAVELKNQGVRPRVFFGERWVTSIFDLFEENVRYFPALLPELSDEDPQAVLEARRRTGAGRAEAAQRDRLPVEPAHLRHARQPPAPAGREPRPPGRPEHHRRHGQRGLLLRGAADADPGGPAGLDADVVRRRRGQLLQRRARRDRVTALLAGSRGDPGHRARAAPSAAPRPRGPHAVGRGAGGARPLPVGHRGPLPQRPQRRVVADRDDAKRWRSAVSTRHEALRQMLVAYAENMHANAPVHTWPVP